MNGESIPLSDGRTLGFRCLGDQLGSPLFFFHGTPGSRFVLSEDDALARTPGLRIILPERPGYGLSDPKPDRTLLDWADDVAELAEFLQLPRFVVAGESGGGPHTLACASALADRVTAALVFGSPSPAGFPGATRGMALGNRLGLFLGRYAPWLVRRLMRSHAPLFEKHTERCLDAISKQMPPSDRALMANEAYREAFLRDLREAYRQGSDAQGVDSLLGMTSRDWGFDLRKITVPVYLWHGEDDTLVSLNMAKRLADEIPTCTPCFVPGAGHLLTEHTDVIQGVRSALHENGMLVSEQPPGSTEP